MQNVLVSWWITVSNNAKNILLKLWFTRFNKEFYLLMESKLINRRRKRNKSKKEIFKWSKKHDNDKQYIYTEEKIN